MEEEDEDMTEEEEEVRYASSKLPALALLVAEQCVYLQLLCWQYGCAACGCLAQPPRSHAMLAQLTGEAWRRAGVKLSCPVAQEEDEAVEEAEVDEESEDLEFEQ